MFYIVFILFSCLSTRRLVLKSVVVVAWNTAPVNGPELQEAVLLLAVDGDRGSGRRATGSRADLRGRRGDLGSAMVADVARSLDDRSLRVGLGADRGEGEECAWSADLGGSGRVEVEVGGRHYDGFR